MLRALLRLVLIIIVVVALGAFFFGYRWADHDRGTTDRTVGTSGVSSDVDATKARETGAAVGEKVAEGANKAERAMNEAALTTKIKAKMTLDDTIQARYIDVDTNGSVVTLSGTVRSEAERARAVQLARETEGVTAVNDRLRISGR
jgi:hyperosmotically inducible periplasmic protein